MAFPQPAPGKTESPGPIKDVPAEKLHSVLGLSPVSYVATKKTLPALSVRPWRSIPSGKILRNVLDRSLNRGQNRRV